VLKTIVLDLDGVILESVEVKTRAFCALFRAYPEHLERIIRLHRENGGVSRYEKFEIIYRDYLKQPLSDTEKSRLGRDFSLLVDEEMTACPYVPGALEFLAEQSVLVPLFVVSGTPEMELQEIVKRRNLDRYLRGCFGSPRRKDVLLREILSLEGIAASEVVFVGDSMTDFAASFSVGAHFVGRVKPGERNPFPESVRWIVSDLTELAGRWSSVLTCLS
jgi:phosphoglycolate phosphatase-like HAD superfamily hydrolase